MGRKLRALAVASVSVCGVMLVAVHAQQNSTKTSARAMTLTAMDYMEIQQLAVRYSYALDSGAAGRRNVRGLCSRRTARS